jgi:hypothetical protein
MRKHLLAVFFFLAAALAAISTAAAETPKLNITLAHESHADSAPDSTAAPSPLEKEQQAKEQLERLAKQYDLKKYTITRDIIIEQGAIAHSSPVLTLNVRFLPRPNASVEQQQAADDLMLSSYLHEQAHWVLMTRHRQDLRALFADLKRLFPDLPTAVPEGDGEGRSTYFHLVVIALEWRGTEDLVGAERARKVVDWKKDDHYKAIYRTVEDHRDLVEDVMKRYHIKW